MSPLSPALRRAAREFAAMGGFERLARTGYLARGVIYVLMGLLAIQLARGVGSSAPSQEGAMRLIAEQAFGEVLLTCLALGLIGYTALRATQALVGRTDEAGRLRAIDRVAAFGSGCAYAFFLAVCIGLLAGSGGSGPPSDVTADVLALPGGRLLVAGAGALFVGIAAYQAHLGATRGFLRCTKTQYMSRLILRRFTALGVAGHLARALVFGAIGGFLVRAAVQFDPAEAVGVDGALRRLADAPQGPAVLVAVALGLICFGAYSAVDARHRLI